MYRFSTYKEQYKANLKLAMPVMLTQVGQITIQFSDNIMVGRFGGTDPAPLAAVSFGGSVFFILFIASIGIAIGLTPLVGEMYAQGNRRKSAELLHNGVIFYTFLGILVSLFQFATIPVLYHLGQPREVVDLAIPFYRLLCCTMPLIMLFFAFKQFLEGVGNTKVETVITIFVNVVNVGLGYLFIFGHGGFPAMGTVGAGLGTLCARFLSPLLIIIYFFRSRYRPYLHGFSLRSLSRPIVKQLLRIGSPISLQMFLESSAFVGTAIMMGWMGEEAISANQIATTIANCAFMIVLSIGIATTIRVSHCYGAHRFDELQRAANASWHLVLAWNLVAAVAFITLRNLIPRLFTENAEVIAMTSSLMFFVALYQLSDGLQNVSVGILRGIQDVKIIMPIAFVAYWLLNLPVGYLFGFKLGMGPSGLFFGFFFGLSAAAILLMRRIRKSIGRLREEN